MKQEMLAKLAEIADMIAEATCDGKQIAEVDLVFNEMMGMVGQLEQAIDYYVDDNAEDDGQPTELEEWHSFDPDC